MVRRGDRKTKTNRRTILKTGGLLGVVGLAGCAGDDAQEDGETEQEPVEDGSEDDQTEDDQTEDLETHWPPDRNNIDMWHGSGPAAQGDSLGRAWGQAIIEQDVFGDAIETYSVTGYGGAEMSFVHDLWNLEENTGGVIGNGRINGWTLDQYGNPDTEYDVREFRCPAVWSSDTRGLQFNPETMPTETHFDMTWEDFREVAEEKTVRGGVASPGHHLFGALLQRHDPVLNEDNFRLIVMPGGGEVRAAMARGDIDVYFASFGGGMTTDNELWNQQFVMTDEDLYPEHVESILDVKPQIGDETLRDNRHAILGNTPFPDEHVGSVVANIMDHRLTAMSPNTPDEVYETIVEGFREVGESDELFELVSEFYGPLSHNPQYGEDAEQVIQDTWDSMIEDDDTREMIDELYNL